MLYGILFLVLIIKETHMLNSEKHAALDRFHRCCWYCIAAAGAGVIAGLAYLQANGGL